MKRSWFLPESPDVLGMLRRQAAVTGEGMAALVGWAKRRAGRGSAGPGLRAASR